MKQFIQRFIAHYAMGIFCLAAFNEANVQWSAAIAGQLLLGLLWPKEKRRDAR